MAPRLKRHDRVTVRDVPGRWWLVCHGPGGLLCLTPDDPDAQLYQWTCVSAKSNGMLRWPEDVTLVKVEPDGVLF